ncbi:MAG: hypothetical protein U0165_14125 [Polyangiaceae bacterium]
MSGDEVPDNDHRYLVFDVARERVRILHVAGRPTPCACASNLVEVERIRR